MIKQKINCTVDFTESGATIAPASVPKAGQQGEMAATEIHFVLNGLNIPAGNNCVFRVQTQDAFGAFHSSAVSVIDTTSDVTSLEFDYSIPRAVTMAGGQCSTTVIISKIDDGETTVIKSTPTLSYWLVENPTADEDPDFKDVSALAKQALNAKDSAEKAAEAAKDSAKSASLSQAAAKDCAESATGSALSATNASGVASESASSALGSANAAQAAANNALAASENATDKAEIAAEKCTSAENAASAASASAASASSNAVKTAEDRTATKNYKDAATAVLHDAVNPTYNTFKSETLGWNSGSDETGVYVMFTMWKGLNLIAEKNYNISVVATPTIDPNSAAGDPKLIVDDIEMTPSYKDGAYWASFTATTTCENPIITLNFKNSKVTSIGNFGLVTIRRLKLDEKVDEARTIAGLSLETDISAERLNEALAPVDQLSTTTLTLLDNAKYFRGVQTQLSLNLPETVSAGYCSELYFISGATASAVDYPDTIYFTGTECVNGIFVPAVNMKYTIIFFSDGDSVQAAVRGVPHNEE